MVFGKPGRPRKEGTDEQMKRWAKDRKRKEYGQENKKTANQAEAFCEGQGDPQEDNEDS
jgi:hypothetical protein